MIYLKKAAEVLRSNLISDKTLFQLQKAFLFNLILLSSIKGYLYKSITQENTFIIPEHVKKCADKKKKILVLDMDETLVYTRSERQPYHKNYIVVKYGQSKIFLEKRPLLDEFFDAISKIFDIYLYTAGQKKYADSILDEIDKKNIIKKRFYRDSCQKQDECLYKDLRYLKKVVGGESQMILIDDNTVSVNYNYPFSIKIKQFEGDQNDKQLANIFQSLLKFYL